MDVLRMIYFAFIHPHLLYSVEIYANTYQTYLSKLVILPEVFSSYFVQNSYIHYYNRRRKCDLHLANMYSAVGKKKSITNKGCNL